MVTGFLALKQKGGLVAVGRFGGSPLVDLLPFSICLVVEHGNMRYSKIFRISRFTLFFFLGAPCYWLAPRQAEFNLSL